MTPPLRNCLGIKTPFKPAANMQAPMLSKHRLNDNRFHLSRVNTWLLRFEISELRDGTEWELFIHNPCAKGLGKHPDWHGLSRIGRDGN